MTENLKQEFDTLERHVNKDIEDNKEITKKLRSTVGTLRSRMADQERLISKMKPYYKLMLGLQNKMNNFGENQGDDGSFVRIDETSNAHHKESEK